MTVEAAKKYDAGEYHFTASGTMAGGSLFQMSDGRAAVVSQLKGAVSGDRVSAQTQGIFGLAAASATLFAVGDDVFWDASADLAITAPASAEDFYCGKCVKEKVDGATEVWTDLNVGGISGGSLGGLVQSPTVELDWEDATEYTVLNAEQNPSGAYVFACFGEITEQCAGGDEDQLICQLLDEDDNVLSVLTVTDGGADAVGDIVQGTQTANGASTGAVLKKVPADKAAKVKVSQATSGAGAAGTMAVTVVFLPIR